VRLNVRGRRCAFGCHQEEPGQEQAGDGVRYVDDRYGRYGAAVICRCHGGHGGDDSEPHWLQAGKEHNPEVAHDSVRKTLVSARTERRLTDRVCPSSVGPAIRATASPA
jgi:hypothetical protein